jgi:signal transduction histidine kinase
LVDNAVKYSPKGTTIRIIASQTSDLEIVIAVEDEGPGIPEELRERVFDKFFRAMRQSDTNIHQTSGGAGMGLAIAKGIVEAHGGRIRIIDTGTGRGTRFEFTLSAAGNRQTELPTLENSNEEIEASTKV